METVQNMLHEGVKYRHLVLTVPEGLRVWFYRYPAEMYEGLIKIAAEMMNDAASTAKGREIELGYIVVLQTAGREANYNPHLHIIMTDGGLDKEDKWQKLGYIPYSILHKKWQYYLLGMVKGVLGEKEEVVRLVDEMWKKYPKGLVAHLKEKAVPKVAGLARYVAKYVVSPPMSLSRIISYERESGKVKYWYEDHQKGRQEVEVSRKQFIGRMVQHILPKGFKRVRYYGLQATCKLKKVAVILKEALKGVVQGVFNWFEKEVGSAVVKLKYRERMKRAYSKDPLQCEECGEEMWLWRVWHPDYGVIYDESEAIKAGKYKPPDDKGDGVSDKQERVVQPSLFEMPFATGYT